MGLPDRPDGMDAVKATFGDPTGYVNDEPRWEALTLAVVQLPTPLIYAPMPATPITRVRAHRLLVAHLADTLMACLAAGVSADRMKYGGCYAWRMKRGGGELSLHLWGIAVDLEPTENPRGAVWADDGKMLDPRIISTFKAVGWFWGGDFKGTPDPMHWQWAEGV